MNHPKPESVSRSLTARMPVVDRSSSGRAEDQPFLISIAIFLLLPRTATAWAAFTRPLVTSGRQHQLGRHPSTRTHVAELPVTACGALLLRTSCGYLVSILLRLFVSYVAGVVVDSCAPSLLRQPAVLRSQR